ncbi:MAG TPA: hypothetical protein VMZ50_06020, partial [Phycisphaerae bacterium]|nr:hypothetical protein [Phycisphaerae bacterium]
MTKGLLGCAVGLLCCCAQGLCAEPPDRAAVVRELLSRSRLLEDIHFRVPVAVWERYAREKEAGLATVPPPAAMIADKGVYHLRVPAERKPTLAVTLAFQVLSPDKVRNLPVLADDYAWEKVTVDGRPAALPTMDRFLRYSPAAPGRHVVRAEAALRKVGRGGGEVALRIPRTVQTHVRFDSPGAWEVSCSSVHRPIRGDGEKGTHGLLAAAPRGNLRIVFRPVAVRFDRAPSYRLRGQVAWNLDAAAAQVTARIDVEISGGASDRIDLLLPAGAGNLRVTGTDVREVRRQGDQAAVHLRGKVRERTALRVRYDLPAGKGGVRKFGRLGVRDGHWAGGTLVVTNTAGSCEVVPQSAKGLRATALAAVPEAAAAILSGPAGLAYEIAAPAWSLDTDVVDLAEFALRETIADLAHYQIALLDDGTMLCKARYEVRNRSRQFLRVDLPPGSLALQGRVNDKLAPVSPNPLAPDSYLLPLVRSAASIRGLVSFPVEIVFLNRVAPLRGGDRAAVPLPRVDLPIAYAWVEAYLPDGMKAARWSGPMRHVDRYASETATESLTYGRSQLAEGYAADQRMRAGEVRVATRPAAGP